MKRFWCQATVAERGVLFGIELDGKPMRMPDGPALQVRSRALAQAIADEWQAAGGEVGGAMEFTAVPLTRLAGTAQQRIAPDPAPTAAALARFAETDALCYRAARPEALVVRQHHAWQPWLDWASSTYGARLLVTNDVMPLAQPADAVAALHDAVSALDEFMLAGLGVMVPALGSLVLGLAVRAGRLDAAEAFRLSVLDELFQEQIWGEDAEAVARRAHVLRDVTESARFMALAAA